MSTVAIATPIALSIASYSPTSTPIMIATVIGGATFGDNLSLISDTTIASVSSQQANLKKKFILNANIAFWAVLILMLALYFFYSPEASLHTIPASNDITIDRYHLYTMIPYIAVIILALCGLPAYLVLCVGMIIAGLLGIALLNYDTISFIRDNPTWLRKYL